MKEKLTVDEAYKMTWDEIIKYYLPGVTDDYRDYMIDVMYQDEVSTKKIVELVYSKYEVMCKLLGI